MTLNSCSLCCVLVSGFWFLVFDFCLCIMSCVSCLKMCNSIVNVCFCAPFVETTMVTVDLEETIGEALSEG